MPRVDYVGDGDRVITEANFAAAGLVSPELVWNKANNFEVDVNEPIAAYLLAVDNDFRVEGAVFGDLIYAKTEMEAKGAAVKQDPLCATLRTNWLNFVRDAGGAAPTQNRQVLGGDYIGGWRLDTDAVAHTWLDAWIAGLNSIDLGDNTYKNQVYLPQRNAVVMGNRAGSLTAQVHDDNATTGQWLNPVDEGLGANITWWPGLGIRDGATDITGVIWVPAHVLDANVSENFGVIGTSLMNINQILFVYDGKVDQNTWGPVDNFWLQHLFRDGDWIYGVGVVLTEDGPPAAHDIDGWRNHVDGGVKMSRVDRTLVGTTSSWTFWDGASWVSGAANAAKLKDVAGNDLHGIGSVPKKVATSHWIQVGRDNVLDPFLSVYQAQNPQGPYKKFCRVPIPFMGGERYPGAWQVCHNASVLTWLTGVTDPDTSVVGLTHTFLGTDENTISGTAFDRTHIYARIPEFITVPHY